VKIQLFKNRKIVKSEGPLNASNKTPKIIDSQKYEKTKTEKIINTTGSHHHGDKNILNKIIKLKIIRNNIFLF